jgi:hypothetical protein
LKFAIIITITIPHTGLDCNLLELIKCNNAIAFLSILVYCHKHKPDVNSSGGQSAKGYHHMSPEASKPESQATQTGSDKFVEGYHPTDGVRPFKQGDLTDVHGDILERGVPAPSDIDPLTLEVTVDKIAIDTGEQATKVDTVTEPVLAPESLVTPWYRKKATKIAGGVLALTGVIGAGAATLGGGDPESTAPRSEPSASAPVNPTPTTNPEATSSPETETGDITNIETRPTAEQLLEAETKVSAEKYPTIEKALPALLDRENAYINGAQMDLESTPMVETSKSVAAGERILDAIYIPGYENLSYIDLSNIQELRHSVGLEFAYLYDFNGGTGASDATFRINFENPTIEKVTDLSFKEAYVITGTQSTESNIEELDPNQTVINFLAPTAQKRDIVLAKDGNWYLRNIENIGH